ncbi:MAG: hypothetical protein JWM05_56 [Acidimicrobiales bacterium]|nr:hypothetical protein [Acidimicrobiales bacterium]
MRVLTFDDQQQVNAAAVTLAGGTREAVLWQGVHCVGPDGLTLGGNEIIGDHWVAVGMDVIPAEKKIRLTVTSPGRNDGALVGSSTTAPRPHPIPVTGTGCPADGFAERLARAAGAP